ncbi:MAG: TFIIB-type zinc ribbon-containing protein [Lachnospiraceae bacterium]
MNNSIENCELGLRLSRRHPRVCPECGGKMIYKNLGEYVCEGCGKMLLDDYGKVRKYLDENGPSTSIEISEETGVKRSVIEEFLRTGRLEVVPDQN